MIITVMIEDDDGSPPDSDRVADWADTYGLTFPVLAGNDDILYDYADGLSSIGLPFTSVIDPGAEIFSTTSGAQVEKAVKRAKNN